MEEKIRAKIAELYGEIDKIEKSDEPDLLTPEMTEVDLLETFWKKSCIQSDKISTWQVKLELSGPIQP